MGRESQVLLGNLEFHSHGGMRHGTEQRVKRFARLEIERSILHLQNDVVAKLAIERHELTVRLLDAIVGNFIRVDERTPNEYATVRRKRISKHVRAVSM